MSYSYLLKKSLIEQKNKNTCCKKMDLYGFLLFSNIFTREKIKVISENEDILLHYASIIRSIFKRKVIINTTVKMYSFTLGSDTSKEIFESFELSSDLPLIDESVFDKDDCCKAAFLNGVFIASGFLYPPQKSYHIEFKTTYKNLANDLHNLLANLGFKSKITQRKSNSVVYIKSADIIKDFLAYIGAIKHMFDFANTAIFKDMRNEVNRIVNCESANIDKTIEASSKQISAIKKLKERKYEGISPQLAEIAELRIKNDTLNLEQLGKILNPPLSKSGVYHRLNKICKAAEKIQN